MTDTHTFDSLLRAGEEGAANMTSEARVAALYEAHREEIYRFLVGQGLEASRAQELAQETFVKLFVALKKGTEIGSERAWLYGVASKLAVDYWRREGRPMWVELDSLPAIADSVRSRDLTPEAALARKQSFERVARTMARLPKEQRLGIHLRMQGLRYRAIAKILGVSVSTTAELLAIAVDRLRSAADE